MDQERKVAIVTGAGQGLGAARLARLVGEGYRVIIAEYDYLASIFHKALQIASSGSPVAILSLSVVTSCTS